MRWLAPISAALLLSFTAAAGAEWYGLTWTLTGLDSEGASAHERFEARPDGTVHWTTAARGVACADEGGSYRGKVSPEELKTLATDGERALASQPSPRPNLAPESPREAVTELRIESGAPGRIRSARITQATDATRALQRRLSELKKGLKPHSVVTFSARRTSSTSIALRFRLKGNGSARVILPQDASEAFRVTDRSGNPIPIRWGSRPKRPNANEADLTARSPAYEATLSAPRPRSGPLTVRYSNALVLHHGSGAAPLSLCSETR